MPIANCHLPGSVLPLHRSMDAELLGALRRRYDIVGSDEKFCYALNTAVQIARTDLPVLIIGENGAGKDVFSRIIHDYSTRSRKKYLALNCGAIPQGTIDSELFGHERGAFTGAVEAREGFFGAADGGTLFLDEIGEMPLSTQSLLLRVLERGEYYKVGSNTLRHTDVRIVAATNKNLRTAITEGTFREDLYYRLCGTLLTVPALRERGDDIVEFFNYFARKFCEKYRVPELTLTAEARQRLKEYKWPGNVREMSNKVEAICCLEQDRLITAETLERNGIVDDGAATALMRISPAANEGYTKEKEQLIFNTIYELSRQVAELRAQVESNDRRGEGTLVETPRKAGRTKTEGTILQAGGDDTYVEDAAELPSLEEMEIRTIRRRLEAFHGDKRSAARSLGISEGALGGRIKKYGLE